MSELLVPVLDGKIGKSVLHKVKAANNSCGLTIYDDNGKLIKSSLINKKIKNTFKSFPSVEVRFEDVLGVNSCIQIKESTQSITLGLFLEIYRAINNRRFQDKWDYVVITGDVIGNSLESVSEIKDKFEGVIEFNKNENKKILFVYVNDDLILKEGVYDEKIQILRFSSKNIFEELFHYLFEASLNNEQISILRNITIDHSNEFVETQTYIGLRNELVNSNQNFQGYLLVGKSNSGKSVIAYNLCLELMCRNIVYAPIWITLNNNKLQEIFNSKDTTTNEKEKLKNRFEFLTEYLIGLIKLNISFEKKYVLVIDNLELSYADEILNGLAELNNKYPNVIFSIITSWFTPSKHEKIKELGFKQIELNDVNFSDFSGILNSVIEGQFTTKLQLLTQEEKSQLTHALFNELKDCPGDLALTLSALQDIPVQSLIEKLKETSIDSNSKKNYFYNLRYEQLGLFSQIILFQFMDKFGCDVCKLSDITELEKEIREKKIIDSTLLSSDAIEKAIKQLVNNYIIQSNLNNEFFIKNSILKFFLFSCKDNKTAWSLSQRFIGEEKKIHISILYNWADEFESIVVDNFSKHEFCLTELARYAKDSKLFDILLNNTDINIDLPDEDGWTPLHLAARYNANLNIFKYLISAKADYRAQTNYGMTVLHFSVSNPEIEILKYILNEHLYDDINLKSNDGWTPLMFAAQFATKPEFLEALINAGASYEIRDNEGNSILHFASVNNQSDIIDYVINKQLYKDINELNGKNQNALFDAVSGNDNIEVIEKLIQNGCKTDLVDTEGNTLLHEATKNNNSNIIDYLLKNHLYTNINAQTDLLKYTPLHEACAYSTNPEIISKLLDYGASKNKTEERGESIYQLVVKNSNENVVDYVFENFPPIKEADFKDNEGESLVHHAIQWNDNVEVIKKLRKRKFDFSEISNTKNTVLHFAAVNENPDILSYVLKHHIFKDINERDENGWTALHFAANENSNPDILNLLLRCGADYKLRTNEGRSVLMLAAKGNTDEIVKYIIQRKLYEDINEADNDGWTAFLHCARSNKVEVLHALYDAGLDWRKKGKNGETCLTVAAENEDLSVIKFICDYGLYDNIDETDGNGFTAFQNALMFNPNIGIMKYLLSEKARTDTKINIDKCTSLHCVMLNPNLEIIKFVIDNKFYSDINELDNDNCNAFIYQIKYNRTLEAFCLLEDAGCDLTMHSTGGVNLLQVAIAHECTEIINYLLEKGICDIDESNFEGEFPLSIAIKDAKNLDYVKDLILHGADYTKKTDNGKSLLLLACKYGCTDIVRFFLQEEMFDNINEKDNSGFTALHNAVMYNENTQILEQLLNYNCDYKKLTNNGDSILSLASINDDSSILNYILANHLYEDINKKNGEGETALHLAARYGNNIDNVKQLITVGASLSEVNNVNSTVLHLAAANKDETMVRLLIEELQFEDIEAMNDYGNTALHAAAVANNIPAFKYLTQLGLNPHELNYDGKSAIDLISLENKGLIDEFMKTIRY